MIDLLSMALLILIGLLFFDVARGTAFTLWLARIMKRPVVQVFFPEGKTEYILLKKDNEYARGIYLDKYNTAYTRTPGSVFLLDNKIPVYVVYLPFGKTVNPAWMKLQAIAMEIAGVKHVREIFTELDALKMEIKDAMLYIERVNAKLENGKELSAKEKEKYEYCTAIVDRYNRLKHAADLIEQINSTLAPQVLDELVLDSDASINAQMIKDAETKERVRAMDFMKKMQSMGPLIAIIGMVIIGIIIVWALVHGGGPNVIQAGTQVAKSITSGGAKAVAEANVVNM